MITVVRTWMGPTCAHVMLVMSYSLIIGAVKVSNDKYYLKHCRQFV